MTTKEEILKEFESFSPKHDVFERGCGGSDDNCDIHTARLWLSSALNKYALSVVEASVPEGMVMPPDEHDTWGEGFNSCRSQTLENARRMCKVEQPNAEP